LTSGKKEARPKKKLFPPQKARAEGGKTMLQRGKKGGGRTRKERGRCGLDGPDGKRWYGRVAARKEVTSEKANHRREKPFLFG